MVAIAMQGQAKGLLSPLLSCRGRGRGRWCHWLVWLWSRCCWVIQAVVAMAGSSTLVVVTALPTLVIIIGVVVVGIVFVIVVIVVMVMVVVMGVVVLILGVCAPLIVLLDAFLVITSAVSLYG